MFFVLAVALFGRIMLGLGQSSARTSDQSSFDLGAQRAAEAGASYARLQLRENADWKGDLNKVTLDTPDMKVVEDNGNVFGWVRSPHGEVAMFRIRFNYQDGSGGGDGMANPAKLIPNTYLSFNNVRSGGEKPVPSVDPGSFVAGGAPAEMVSRGVCLLRVEGWAGSALHRTTGPLDEPGVGPLQKRLLRIAYGATMGEASPDSALSAGGGLHLQTDTEAKVVKLGLGVNRVRSKKGVSVVLPDKTPARAKLNMKGSVTRDPKSGLFANFAKNKILEANETVGDGQDFHNIAWEDVPKASTARGAKAVAGGIYRFGGSVPDTLTYYDMTISEFKALANANPKVDPPGGVLVSARLGDAYVPPKDPEDPEAPETGEPAIIADILIDRDIEVKRSRKGNDHLIMIGPHGAPVEGEGDTSYQIAKFDGAPAHGRIEVRDATISARGDIAMLGDVIGNDATFTSEGDLVIIAPSVDLKARSSFKQRLSIYTKGKATISTYQEIYTNSGTEEEPNWDQTSKYGPLDLEGLIYTWDDCRILGGATGKAPVAGQPNNEVKLRGAVVAYGANPSLFDE
jgi:hypothetical protein